MHQVDSPLHRYLYYGLQLKSHLKSRFPVTIHHDLLTISWITSKCISDMHHIIFLFFHRLIEIITTNILLGSSSPSFPILLLASSTWYLHTLLYEISASVWTSIYFISTTETPIRWGGICLQRDLGSQRIHSSSRVLALWFSCGDSGGGILLLLLIIATIFNLLGFRTLQILPSLNNFKAKSWIVFLSLFSKFW